MQLEQTVNKHRGAMLIAIGAFLVFLYVRHKRQQAAAAADAAAQAAQQPDPGTMDQNTYSKQFSQPAPAYLGAPFSGFGANVTYPPPTQLVPGAGPASPTPPITFPNPAAAGGASGVGAATGGGAPSSGGTGQPPGTPQQQADEAAGMATSQQHATLQQPKNPAGLTDPTSASYWVPNNPDGSPGNIDTQVGYTGPQVGTGLYLGAAGEPGAPGYMGIGYVPPEYRPQQ